MIGIRLSHSRLWVNGHACATVELTRARTFYFNAIEREGGGVIANAGTHLRRGLGKSRLFTRRRLATPRAAFCTPHIINEPTSHVLLRERERKTVLAPIPLDILILYFV